MRPDPPYAPAGGDDFPTDARGHRMSDQTNTTALNSRF